MTMAAPVAQSVVDGLNAAGCKVGSEKLKGSRGEDYEGCQSITRSGIPCQKWTEQSPHSHEWKPEKYANLGDHNFCRNPYQQDTIWCITTDPTVRFDYCDPYECGNGRLEVIAGETCDDGNRENGDGCNKKCQIETGFVCLVPEGVELPRSYCKRCRNGIREGAEECDDGNSDPFDGCDPYCNEEEGWHCRPYHCDCDGHHEDHGGGEEDRFIATHNPSRDCPCPEGVVTGQSDCRPAVCGDGLKWHVEQCDDGNDIDSDGCSHECKIEAGFTCDEDENRKSRCYNCGNDHIDAFEECDDGNEEDGDGCSSTCMLEPGAAYVDEKGFIEGTEERPANFSCRYSISTRPQINYTEQALAEAAAAAAANDTEAGSNASGRLLGELFADGDARLLQTLRADTRNTICSEVLDLLEKHRTTFIIYGCAGGVALVLFIAIGYECYKRHKNKLRLKKGEILIVGKDGQVKKINTFNAVLTLQFALKRSIKRRRAAKEMEAKAAEQQDALRRQAQALQEKKWKRQMMESSAKYEADENANQDNV
jgi:cysteine-rich repeat protein